MALKERDRNKMSAQQPRNHKRKQVDVDLTQDSEDDASSPGLKKSRGHSGNEPNQQSNSTNQYATPYATPPNSSAVQENGFCPSQTTTGSSSTQASNNLARSNSTNPSAYVPSVFANSRENDQSRDSWLASQDDEEDINEIVASTQIEGAEDTDQLQLYGELNTKVVGCRFYTGYANPSETILIRREPGNPYDSNAIRIDNMATHQIGHMPRNVAAKLAKYIDNRWAHLEGALAGSIGEFDCPLLIRVFGPPPQSDAGLELAARMKCDKLPTNALKEAERAEKQRQKEREAAEKRRKQQQKAQLAEARRAAAAAQGGSQIPLNPSSQYANKHQGDGIGGPVMDDILEASQRFNPRALSETTEKYGIKEEALKAMASAKQPRGVKTAMLLYQLQALHWLLDKENPQLPTANDTVQLWKNQGNRYTNIATNYSQSGNDIQLASGGILADDMGLGKTLEMISLLMADNEQAGKKTGTTLIVSPLSVMSNWVDQIKRHVKDDAALNVYVYHGSGRNDRMSASDLSQYDVVITTYATLATDYMPKKKGAQMPKKELRRNGLYSLEWRRVILDEGHQVRNPSSKGAAAVLAVIAKNRWVLTGTPIVNSLKDLYSLLRFIGITGGLERLEIFNSALVRPLKGGDASAGFLLQAIMTAFTLRRNKDMKFIDLKLPELKEFLHGVEFSKKERERYEALEMEAKGLLKSVEQKAASGAKSNNHAFQHLLEVLLRMRQCCNHWQMCGERVSRLLEQLESAKTVNLTPENKKALQDVLQVHIESQEDCAVCLESLHDPVITTCAHFFGRSCIEQVIQNQHKCPMCRADLKDESCLVNPAHEHGDEEKDDEMDLNASSTKLEALVNILNASKESGDKTVIFSQWTRFLDIVENRLEREGFEFCRIDGTMTAPKRDAALRTLENDKKCTVMLASLGVCAVGLNLTSANQIILSDTWWAPAIEDQAVDRVHRLGQKKECRVFRLVMENTIEQSTIDIQQEKRKLMMLAFSERSNKRDASRAGVLKDIQKLLRAGTSG